MTIKSPTTEHAAARAFNDAHPIGTPVRYWKGVREGSGKVSHTRTEAQLLSGHTAVVWLEGVSGCIALTHVQPISEEEFAESAQQPATTPTAGAALDPAAWCRDRARNYRYYEESELAMYPSNDHRDASLVEWTVRALGNADLEDSPRLLAVIAAQHHLELNPTGSVEWLQHRVKELTAELEQTRAVVEAAKGQGNGNERAIKHVQGLLEYLEQGDYQSLAEDEVANLALDFKAILADLGRPVADDEDTERRAVVTVAVPGVSL